MQGACPHSCLALTTKNDVSNPYINTCPGFGQNVGLPTVLYATFIIYEITVNFYTERYFGV